MILPYLLNSNALLGVTEPQGGMTVGVTEPQGGMTVGVTEPQGHEWNDWGSLEGGVTHPYDTVSSALGLQQASLLQMGVLS